MGVACSLILISLIKDSNTPRWLDLFTGTLLILISVIFLGVLHDLQGLVVENSDNSDRSEQLFTNFQIAILIFPFVSSAIGTNLISYAITYDRNYSKSEPFKTTINKLFIKSEKIINTALCTLFLLIAFLIWITIDNIRKIILNKDAYSKQIHSLTAPFLHRTPSSPLYNSHKRQDP